MHKLLVALSSSNKYVKGPPRIMECVKKNRPLVIILENVYGLLIGNQHLCVVQALEVAGYVVVWWLLNPWDDSNWPHSRQRIYFLAFRKSSCLAAGMTEAKVIRHATEVMQLLRAQPKSSYDLDTILKTDDSILVQTMKADALSAHAAWLAKTTGPTPKQIKDAHTTRKWVEQHHERGVNTTTSRWSDDLAMRFPD